MDELVASFRRSVPKTIFWVAIAALATAGCVGMALGFGKDPSLLTQIFGWIGAPAFGLATLAMLVQLFRSSPVIEISTAGIRYRGWPQTFVVPWTAVAGVSEGMTRSTRNGVLQLGADSPAARTRTIWMSGLQGSVDDLLDAIRWARTRAARGDGGSNPIRQQD